MFALDNLLIVLCGLGILQGLLLAAAAASNRQGPRKANWALSAILLGACAALTSILLSHRGAGWTEAPSWHALLEVIEVGMWLLAGPLTLLYVTLVSNGDRLPSGLLWTNFLPGILWLVAGILVTTVAQQRVASPPVELLILHQTSYSGFSIYRWWLFRTDSRSRPDVEPANLGTHGFWVPAVLAVVVVQHLGQIVRWGFSDVRALEDLVPTVGAFSFVVLSLLGLRRALGQPHPAASTTQPPTRERTKPRYATSSLTDERLAELDLRLRDLMATDRLYLQPDLTVDDVAATLGIGKSYVSQVLNESVGESFLEFLTRYRIEESLRLLADDSTQHLKVEAIGNRSGFGSRSSFYQAFRRSQGTTPAEFRKRTQSRQP